MIQRTRLAVAALYFVLTTVGLSAQAGGATGTTSSGATGAAKAAESVALTEVTTTSSKSDTTSLDKAKDSGAAPASLALPSAIEVSFRSLLPSWAPPTLGQYGYDLFQQTRTSGSSNVSPQYVLGVGDKLSILVWGDPVDLGELPPLVPAEVNRAGGLFYAPVGLLPAAGQTLQDTEKAMTAGLAKKYKRFELRLSLSQVREFPITVSGFVRRPGLVMVTNGASVLDALTLSGGVTPNGTLRSLVIRSLDGSARSVDLYDTLVGGKPIVAGLKEGDTLFVPPIGPVAGVWGAVKRPGIYELTLADRVASLLEYAGGRSSRSVTEHARLTTVDQGRVAVVLRDLAETGFLNAPVPDGSVLEVAEGTLDTEDGVFVRGTVTYPGWYDLRTVRNLRALVEDVGVQAITDMDHAQIVRIDRVTFDRTVLFFSPRQVLTTGNGPELKESDQVRFFPKDGQAPVTVMGEVKNPLVVPYHDNLTLEAVLALTELKGDPMNLKVHLRWSTDGFAEVYLRDRYGKRPSLYQPLPPGTAVIVKALDFIDRAPLVYVTGEVQRPGGYRLTPGLTLSQLVNLAGGFRSEAFPQGLLFLRESIVDSQRNQASKTLDTMDAEILALEAAAAAATDPMARAAAEARLLARRQARVELANQLTNTLGRIGLVVPSRWSDLAKQGQDLLLEDGDKVHIPTVPRYVMVLGAVYNQGTQAYQPGQSVQSVLNRGGGVTDTGNKDRTYVVRANGLVESSAAHLGLFGNGLMGLTLEPGDAVVVPLRDPNTVDGWSVFKESLTVLGTTIGITANSMAILQTLGALK